jgi:putative transposase
MGEKGNISKFMQKVSTAYVMYYNKKYQRTGGLFEGKFKSQYVDSDRYLKYLFSYIHLNCLKLLNKNWREEGFHGTQKALDYLSKYRYSSYPSYLGVDKIQGKILNIKAFPKYFPNAKSLNEEILDWINYNESS